jgi:uncharacterized protein YdeI (BOF family)
MIVRTLGMLAVFALSAPASAHHSFAAFYFEDQSVSIEGVVTEFHYVNPHTWVYVSAADAAGIQRTVGAEWSNPARLAQAQIKKDTIKPGDRVIITGSPARDTQEPKIHLKRIVRLSDGWTWAGRAERPASAR